MNINNIDDLFDDKKLKKSIIKAKIKSIIKIVLIVFIILAALAIFNIYRSNTFGKKEINKIIADVSVSIPNAQVTEIHTNGSMFSNETSYKITKRIGNKTKLIASDTVNLTNPLLGHSYMMSKGTNNWESGDSFLRFYHPNVEYNSYKNILNNFDDLSNDLIYEVGISLDKAYTKDEIISLFSYADNLNISWLWFDTYTKTEIDQMKAISLSSNEGLSEYINLSNIYGVSPTYISDYSLESDYIDSTSVFISNFNNWLKTLQESDSIIFNKLYTHLTENNLTKPENIKVIGLTVQGTKEELKSLLDNEHIKAATIGATVSKY